ncbi:hypothetical protein BMS3Abin15_01032 [bacterium BMS3Abin15]|nr:hypothetical protein BMS3Abin15_01032 [bacterium BMS3Abin15]
MENNMSTGVSKEAKVKIKEYVTDKEGHKVAAIIDIKEIGRVERMLEDLYDLKLMEDRAAEPEEDYTVYSKRRKSGIRV